MTDYMNHLIQIGLGNIIDTNVDEEILKDKSYCDAMKTAELLQQKLKTTTLSDEQREILEEYSSSLLITCERCSQISYLVGLRDSLLFLNNLQVINVPSEHKQH